MSNLPIGQEEENEPATWEDIRKRVIDSSIQIPASASPEAQWEEMHSRSMALLRAFMD